MLPRGAPIETVWIEPGTFVMGLTEGQEQLLADRSWLQEHNSTWEQPAHQVTISRGFWLGKYELTQEQWERVMGTCPWEGQTWQGMTGTGEEKLYHRDGPNYPAVWISRSDVQAFVAKLNESEGAQVYRLPTEAEWEYACRAGTRTLWSFGNDADRLGEYAWYDENCIDAGEVYAHAVGTKLPNPWGLYDMHGNVGELCQDSESREYTMGAEIDPIGPSTGTHYVIRGGVFWWGAQHTRSMDRGIWPSLYQSTGWVQTGMKDRRPTDGGVWPSGTAQPWLGVRLLREGLLQEGLAPRPTPVSPGSWGQIKAKLR